ncbi:MAG: sulfur carrier protein ThiS [Burkholderiaceae bacterium]
MHQITVNAVAHQVEPGTTLTELLERLSLAGKRIAVEHNGAIVPKSAHDSTTIEPGDQFEIVVAVGGG